MSPWGSVAPWWLAVAGCSAVVVLWHTAVLALLLELWRAWSPAAPARRQYAAAVAALVGAVVLTIATPVALVQLRTSPAAARDASIVSAATSRGGPTLVAGPRRATPPPAGSGPTLASFVDVAVPWIGAIALAGIVFSLARVAAGWTLAQWIRRRATAVDSPLVVEAAAAVRAEWGLPDAVLLASSHVDAPVVVGARTPAVLLPPDLERRLGPDGLSPLLAHELAHVGRRDYAANLAQSVADALLWFSPGARLISRRIRETREYCCDDVAATRCGPAPYADALTRLAGLGAASPARPALNAVGPRLIVRIRRLLKEDAMSPFARYRFAGLLASLGLAAAAGMAVIPVSAAGVTQAPSSADLERWPVPHGVIREQKGAAVVLEQVAATESSICGTAVIENRANVATAGLKFAAFAMPRRGSHEPNLEAMRVSDWLPVEVAPGATASIAVGLMSRDDVRQLGGPDPQAMCALTEIRYANGATWRSAPLVVFAPSHSEIPRDLIGAPAPSDAPVCKDAKGLAYSHGALIRVALEPGTLATCDNGRWIEGQRSVGRPAPARR
jgi:beta-lactamase regulating signal transducer with metallopeptidase domain